MNPLLEGGAPEAESVVYNRDYEVLKYFQDQKATFGRLAGSTNRRALTTRSHCALGGQRPSRCIRWKRSLPRRQQARTLSLMNQAISIQVLVLELASPSDRPFQMKAERGSSYGLDLPQSYLVYPVIHLGDNPPCQQLEAPEPDEINGALEWEVDFMTSSRIYRGRLQYKVQWKGFDPDEEWYPASNFKNAARALQSYHEQYPERPGPSVRLEPWLRAAEQDEFVEDHKDDEKAAKTGD